MRVTAVEPHSPFFGYVRAGHRLVSVNGRSVSDSVDLQFCLAEERVSLCFTDQLGRRRRFQIAEPSVSRLGLSFEEDCVKVCDSDCIFCFVRQQPKGMRRALYLKDDDYRLSFTHGNFITLSNVSRKDITRIVKQRLSPLYVSVHTTDTALRRRLFRNQGLPPVLPILRRLVKGGIRIHSQVVVCPGINDGPLLDKTINDLARLFPSVETLAIVPVGLTKYRRRLPELTPFDAESSNRMIDLVADYQRRFLRQLGSHFVWAADEFYVQADREFPRYCSYEAMAQFENGVGMARALITGFNRRRAWLRGITPHKRVLLLTGHSAHALLERHILPYLRVECNLPVLLEPVRNRFWGDSVTVSGLLTGKDLLANARACHDRYDLVVLPPNCLNHDRLFLDDLSLDRFRDSVGKPVLVGSYNFAETIREAFA